MATETKNYGFIKPDINEFYDRNIDNENLDKIDEELKRIEEAAGNLDDLDTEEKTGLVAAINELKTQIGNLTNLETEEKASLVSSVNEIHRMVSEHLAEKASKTELGHVQIGDDINVDDGVISVDKEGVRTDSTKPFRTEVVSSLPQTAEKGQIVFLDDPNEPAFKGYNGGEWL